jgi:predicted transcriptional regulator
MLTSSLGPRKEVLDELLQTLDSGITARSIASPLSHALQVRDSTSKALKYMEEHKYDRVVVADGESTIGYVDIENLRRLKQDGDALVETCVSTFGPDLLISEETPLPVVLHRLQRESSLFIVGRDGLNAIITRADVEKQFMRVYAFGLVSLMEQELSQLLANLPCDVVADAIPDEKERESFETLFEGKESADAELAPIYYACLGTKIKLFVKRRENWDLLGDSQRHARFRLMKIQKLRNKLDHVNPLITRTDSLKNLDAILSDLTDVIRILESAMPHV